MNMYFSARTQTLAQFKEAYDKRLLNETPDGAILCSYMCIRDCFQTITMRIQKITGLW